MIGDWFGKSILPADIPCNDIVSSNEVLSNAPVLWSVGNLVKEIEQNSTNEWRVKTYLTDALGVIRSKQRERDNSQAIILHIGDGHYGQSTLLPAIAKTRFSPFAIERNTSNSFYETIIWPLNLNRHYLPVDQYMKIYKEGKVCEWEDKHSSLIWRGGVTGLTTKNDYLEVPYPKGGPRIHAVSTYFNKDVSTVDVAFTESHPSVSRESKNGWNVTNLVRGTHTSMEDQLKYKYMLVLEGNDVATGLKWQLASNSVVFMAKPTTVSFMMEDLLIPFVHCIPVKDDYSDLIQMVHWARDNDAKCVWISEQATLFMERLWTSLKAKKENMVIKKGLSKIYQRQFGDAVKSCMTT